MVLSDRGARRSWRAPEPKHARPESSSEIIDTAATWKQYLASFVEDPGYLDFARVGPISTPVERARTDATRILTSPTAQSIDHSMRSQQRSLALAASIAGLPVEQFVYVPNTSTGLFQVAFALRPRGSRDQVLLSAGEFPSNLYPWVRAETTGGLTPSVVSVPDGVMTPSAVSAALTDRTAAVAVSVVDFRTGYLTDLSAIRDVIGDRLLIVDAIQGFGVSEVDWAAADAVVVGGQKWLRAGWGTGFVVVSDRLRDGWDPKLAGWTGVQDVGLYDGLAHPLLPTAQALSLTNLSPIDQAGFVAALELVESVGVSAITRQIDETATTMAAALDGVGADVHVVPGSSHRTGIVPFSIPDRPAPLVHADLLATGISSTLHSDRIRLSIHASTTAESIDMVLAALG